MDDHVINLSKRVRGYLYVLVLFGGPVVAYLMDRGIFGPSELAFWTAITSAIALVARFNLGSSPRDQAPGNGAR